MIHIWFQNCELHNSALNASRFSQRSEGKAWRAYKMTGLNFHMRQYGRCDLEDKKITPKMSASREKVRLLWSGVTKPGVVIQDLIA